MESWPKGISAITLFVEDLAATKQFYQEVFGLAVHYEDDASAVFNFGNTLINLLAVTEAHGLIEPAAVADPAAGSRVQFTIDVDDVDAMCAELAKRGVQLLNGPMDRPWGIRTSTSTRGRPNVPRILMVIVRVADVAKFHDQTTRFFWVVAEYRLTVPFSVPLM